jgi:hypothetical protein
MPDTPETGIATLARADRTFSQAPLPPVSPEAILEVSRLEIQIDSPAAGMKWAHRLYRYRQGVGNAKTYGEDTPHSATNFPEASYAQPECEACGTRASHLYARRVPTQLEFETEDITWKCIACYNAEEGKQEP